MEAAIIRQGELVGRELMAYETAETAGSVDHLLVDVKGSRVVGLVSKASGLMSRKHSLSWAQLVKIGKDSIVIHTEASPEVTSVNEAQLAAGQNMIGLEVWTDGGDHIGRIVDVCLDRATGEVQQYLFALHRTAEEVAQSVTENASAELAEAGEVEEAEVTVSVYAIAPNTIISAGRKRMMIAEEDAQRAQPYGQPLTIKTEPDSSPGWRPDQLPAIPKEMIPTDFNDLLQKGQSFAGRVTNQVKQRAKQFTDEQLTHQDFVEGDSLPDITEQLQSKTEQVRQQMQSQIKKAKDKAQEQIGNKKLEDRLGNSSLGRSLGQTLDRFKRKEGEPSEPIDVDAFEVWEDD